MANCKADDVFCAFAGGKQRGSLRTDFPHAEVSWQGRQIVHTKKGTKIRKNEGIWNNETFTAEKITESLFS